MKTNDWKKNYQQIPISDLNLDLKNPRTDTGNNPNKEAVIDQLLDENILKIIESISKKGYAASVVLMVIEEKGKKIVIDGNRRLLASKILHNPNTVKKFIGKSIIKRDFKKFQELSATKKEDVRHLTVILYPNRKLAESEMSILHLDGEAVQKWKPLRQYRYFSNRLLKEKLSIDDLSDTLGISQKRIKDGIIALRLYEAGRSRVQLPQKSYNRIFDDKKFKTDKFRKTVVNSEGKRFLKYSLDRDNNLKISDEILFTDRLTKTLKEVYNKESAFFANAQYPSENRVKFFKTIDPNFFGEKEYKKAIKKKQKEIESGLIPLFESEESKITDEEYEQIKERSDKKPSGLFYPSNVPYKLKNRSLQKVYDELKNPNILQFPNATHDLLRSFLECSLVAYLKHKSIDKYFDVLKCKKKKQKTLTLRDMLDYISDEKTSPITDGSIRSLAHELTYEDSKDYSITKRMDMINHNENYFSTEKEVRNTWEKIEPLLKIILNPKK